MIIYGLKNCDACKALLKVEPDFELIDVSITPVPENILEKAIENFDQAIKLDPKYKPAYFNRATCFMDLNKNEEAINSLKPPVFWKDKPIITNQAKKWNKFKIKKILIETLNVEKKIKTNSAIEKNILIKKLLIDICLLANA